jgi:hypothetical protein
VYGDADTAVAAQAADALSDAAYAPIKGDSAERAERLNDLCWIGLWRVQEGRLASADSALQALRRGGDTRCEPLVAAHLSAARGGPPAGNAFRRLDSLVRAGAQFTVGANLSLTRLYEARAQRKEALAAVRRRARWTVVPGSYISTFVQEEGRLAALTGDTTGAIRAYRHYLALRAAPEPSRLAERDRVRAELERLTSRERGRD